MRPRLAITRLVRPLHGGGSLPWLVEASDGRPYVAKLSGAGHGAAALLVELVVASVGSAWWPEVLPATPIWLDAAVPVAGTDEMWDVQRASRGWNLAIPFIADARELRAEEVLALAPATLSRMVTLDTLFANLDRTAGSPNVLGVPDGRVWFIDHGSCRFLHRPAGAPRTLPPNHILASTGVAPARAPAQPPPLPPLPPEWLAAIGLGADDIAARLTAMQFT